MSLTAIKAAIRDIPDFPKPGIIYKDITPLLQDSAMFAEIIHLLAARYQDNRPDYIVGIESRGFIFGAALAMHLECGFAPIRKAGKLPYRTIKESYQLEYGEAEIEIHVDAIPSNATVILIDDLLATGGTAAAAVKLLNRLEADIVGIEFIIELPFLDGRSKLSNYKINSLIS